MSNAAKVVSETAMSNSFVGDTIQICVVTEDFFRTIDGFLKLGIGPWRVYTFSPQSVSDQTYMGKAGSYSMRLALAFSGTMMWEVIQPLEGAAIYKDWLKRHGEGIQHVAQSCGTMAFDEQIREFERRGLKVIQSGFWRKEVRYAYIGTEDLTGTTVELIGWPENYSLPDPEQWYPAPPPKQ